MDESIFQSDFIREYLRQLQKRRSTLTGLFYSNDKPFIWGAIAEYGDPPVGGLLIEIWPEGQEDTTATYRFWHAVMPRARYIRGRTVARDELLKEIPNG